MAIPGLEVTYPLIDKGPGNPNIPPGGSADAQAVRAERLRQAGVAAPTATTSTAAPNAPSAGQRLRSAGSNLVSGAAYLGAGVAGQAAARSLRDMGGGVSGLGAAVGERQAGDSASSMQIPTGGPTAPPAQGYNFWTDSEAGRNIGNMANAIAPLGGVAMAARVPGAASRVAGLADAAVTGLASGVRGEREARAPAPPDPSLRVRPEDAFAGPPSLAAGKTPPAAATTPAVGNVTRNGNEYSGTNVRGDITVNGFAPGAGLGLGSGPNAQNMAAGNNLAAANSLRSQGAVGAVDGQGGMALPQAPTVRHSGNDWDARNTLRNAEVSASSITNTRRWGGKGAENSPDVQAYKAMLDNDLALQRTEPGVQLETLRSNNGLRGQKLAADASRYGSDNSLRGTMYSSDATLGAKRMEMQQRLQQQQLVGEAFRRTGGDPVATAKILAGAGLTEPAKSFQDMAAADQARGKANSEDAQSTFKGMFTRDGEKGPERDENAEAMAHHLASQIVPGWENMSQEQRNANRSKVVEYTNILQQANKNRDTSWLQKFGLAPSSTARSQIPDLNGAVVDEVGWFEGALKPNIGRGDKKVTLRDGSQMYFDSLNEAQQRLLETNGARRQQ